MRVPSLEPGKHTLKLKLDTKCLLGTLATERQIIVEDGSMAKLADEYRQAVLANKVARAEVLRGKLVSRFSRRIRPGEEVLIDKAITASVASASAFSAKVKLYPDAKGLRAVIDVKDAEYAKASTVSDENPAAMVYLIAAPRISDKEIAAFILSSRPGEEQPSITAFRSTDGPGSRIDKSSIKATWKSSDKGYVVDFTVPWDSLQGYKPTLRLLPLQVVVMTRSQGMSAFGITKTSDPFRSARLYPVITWK